VGQPQRRQRLTRAQRKEAIANYARQHGAPVQRAVVPLLPSSPPSAPSAERPAVTGDTDVATDDYLENAAARLAEGEIEHTMLCGTLATYLARGDLDRGMLTLAWIGLHELEPRIPHLIWFRLALHIMDRQDRLTGPPGYRRPPRRAPLSRESTMRVTFLAAVEARYRLDQLKPRPADRPKHRYTDGTEVQPLDDARLCFLKDLAERLSQKDSPEVELERAFPKPRGGSGESTKTGVFRLAELLKDWLDTVQCGDQQKRDKWIEGYPIRHYRWLMSTLDGHTTERELDEAYKAVLEMAEICVRAHASAVPK
jgi:hypothetical protein